MSNDFIVGMVAGTLGLLFFAWWTALWYMYGWQNGNSNGYWKAKKEAVLSHSDICHPKETHIDVVSSAPKEKCLTYYYEVGKPKEEYTICLLPKRHLPPCKPEPQDVSREEAGEVKKE